MASAIAIIDDERQLIATETGLHVRDVATGKLTLHTPIEADNPLTRSNDLRVHPCGAFWVGTMGKGEEKGAGSIYWFFKGELRKLYSGITVSNSICFSQDGTIAYYTDTATGLLMRVACDPATGLPGRRAEGVRRSSRGARAMSTARSSTATACCGTPSGAARRSRPIRPTARCCAKLRCRRRSPRARPLSAPKADRLAVTSAWKGKDDKQRKLDPQAGMTFLLDIPVNGRFEPRVLIA